MARNETVTIEEDVWTEVTLADATKITAQVIGPYGVRVASAVGAVEPDAPSNGLFVAPGHGLDRYDVATLLPGVAGATRVFMRSEAGRTSVFVSHD